MPQIDVTVPEKTFNAEQKGQLLSRLTQALNKWEGVPPTSPNIQWAWAFIHETAQGDWAFGGKVASSEDKPRYRLLITVPEGVMDAAHKQGLIEEVTGILVELEGDSANRSGPPLVTCIVLDVADGGYGVAGRVFHLPKTAA